MRIRLSHFMLFALVGSFLGLCTPVVGQGIPDSPTGRIAKALAKFSATSGEVALETFLNESVTPMARKDGAVAISLQAFRESCPMAQIRGANKKNEWEAAIQFGSKGGPCRVSYRVDSESPHGLQSLEFTGGDDSKSAKAPDSDRGRLVDQFVEAYNSGEVERMMAYYRDNATEDFQGRRNAEEDKQLYERLRRELGQLESPNWTEDGDDQIRLIAHAGKAGEEITLVIKVVPGPPLLLDGFSINIGGPPGGEDNPLPPVSVAPNASRAQKVAAFDRYLKQLAEDGVFSGSVLISRGGDIAFEGQYGMANRENGIPVTAKTRFDIGSITKNFTKVAIGQLARDGKLSFDDRLIEHVPDYPNREIARKITIGQLLTHSSGMGDMFNERFEKTPKDTLLTPKDFFPIFAEQPLEFEPGTGRQYSNAGYIVLGAVVEGASGMTYTDYLQKEIFKPAHMKASGFPKRDGSHPELAIGYTNRGSANGQQGRNIGMLPIRGCPAGSSSHTAADLLRFDNKWGRFPNRGFGDSLSLIAIQGVPKTLVWKTSP